ncbi:4-hydroxy-3-methylbut-2-enyl diphosphate reductase [Advenella faeciporci]|uniref:4-hydroxy-3-methylbut-2-enyl diphosphate reductase n=1 Tax=Advenella faeciporci TaxID=797535 RepID=A0A918JEB4_9BURK|nr:4-hydroxy-3-methylbut-2-enyl diphosphate reductase [Advenella faeciporci]GGW76466.1 4-hydroxy-3-methylbut-2-enyl diphosphate reductase [Advenella faeciporci]
MTAGMEILLADPRGFCAGVDRAIDIVVRALELHGTPIYVRHEIVHNRFVVESLRKQGAIFIDELDEAPAGAIVVFSAHGVSKAVRQEAQDRGLKVFDATCPLVTKVHVEVSKMHAEGREIIMIGHKGHPEVEGTLGQAKGQMYLVETPEDVENLVVVNPDNLAFVTQTTLSVDDAAVVSNALRKRFPNIVAPKKADICYATQNRQDAVKMIAPECDVFFVVGSVNSSNSNRLREVAERLSCPAYLIDGAEAIQPEWLENARHIGITAGASAPEVLVQEVIARLRELGAVSVRKIQGAEENVSFPLPKELSRKK